MTEARRTIPQIRAALHDHISTLASEIGERPILAAMRELIEETKRRAPTFRAAPNRYPDPSPELIREIREFKAANPEVPHQDIAVMLETSTRCISLALAGRRDGSPVFDENGAKVRRNRRMVAA